MICKNCNNEIPEGGYFCPKCGTRCQEGVHPLLRKEAKAEENEVKAEASTIAADEEVVIFEAKEEAAVVAEEKAEAAVTEVAVEVTEAKAEEPAVVSDSRKKAAKVGFIGGTKRFFKNRHKFKMRASRSEFWWGLLGALLHWGIVGVIKTVLGPDNFFIGILGFLLMLPIYIGFVSLNIRRLHDTGSKGHWFWFILLPVVGWIILVIKCSKKSADENKWGEAPVGKMTRKQRKEEKAALKAAKKAAKEAAKKKDDKSEAAKEPVTAA